MLLRGILSAAALAVAAAASAGAALERPAGSAARSAGDTLALAPMSLGNRAAAATLRTRREDRPLDREPAAGAPIPSFRYDLRVGPGDTLAGLLTGAGVSNADTQGAIRALSGHFNPKRLRQGQRIAVATQLRKVRELSFMQCEVWAEGRQVMRASGTWKYLASRAPGATGMGAII